MSLHRNPASVSAIAGTPGASGIALEPGDAKRPKLALLHVGPGARQIVEHHLDVAGEQIGDRRRAALVGHVRHLHAGHLLEQLARQMNAAAGPGAGEIVVLGMCLQEAMNSATFCAGTDGWTTRIFGVTKKFDTATKSRSVSNGKFFFTAGNTEFTDPVPMSSV